jgi:hypothetical protein
MKKENSNQFCHEIYDLDLPFKKVLINVLLSLSSYDSKSVVGLSESPLFTHSYSSISQALSGLSINSTGYATVLCHLQPLWMKYYPYQTTYSFQTDTSPMNKAFSKKLGERQYVNVPNNVVPGNKSLDIGYNYSYINLGYTAKSGGSRWSLPLSVERVKLDSDGIKTALAQIAQLMTEKTLPFEEAQKVINSSDSGYFTARYLSPLVENYANMIQICRSRHGSKVWQQASPTPRTEGQKGADAVYGDTPYYLMSNSDVKTTKNGKTKVESTKNRTAIYDLAPTETVEIETVTSRGRALIVKIDRWDNMMIRTKGGYSMKDKPFNLFASQVIDAETGEVVFKKPMFIGVFGKLKDEITTIEAYQEYRNRYDIEVHNRFSSQKLLFNDYQTPDVQTLDNWTLIVATAYWLLFVAADEVELKVKPWERNLPKNKEIMKAQKSPIEQPKKSVAQTKKGALTLFYTFDRKKFAPKSVNNGKGRKKGFKPTRRKDNKVNRKAKKSNLSNEIKQNE